MFVAHFAVGFAAKRFAPKASLGVLLLAPLYERTTRAVNRVGRFAWYALLGLLCLIYAGAVFGPPPPNVDAIIASGFAAWLFVPWAAWIDRNRTVRSARG